MSSTSGLIGAISLVSPVAGLVGGALTSITNLFGGGGGGTSYAVHVSGKPQFLPHDMVGFYGGANELRKKLEASPWLQKMVQVWVLRQSEGIPNPVSWFAFRDQGLTEFQLSELIQSLDGSKIAKQVAKDSVSTGGNMLSVSVTNSGGVPMSVDSITAWVKSNIALAVGGLVAVGAVVYYIGWGRK